MMMPSKYCERSKNQIKNAIETYLQKVVYAKPGFSIFVQMCTSQIDSLYLVVLSSYNNKKCVCLTKLCLRCLSTIVYASATHEKSANDNVNKLATFVLVLFFPRLHAKTSKSLGFKNVRVWIVYYWHNLSVRITTCACIFMYYTFINTCCR